MVREKIILSDIDFKLMEFLREEHIIREIMERFEFSFSQSRLHLKRLEDLKYITIERFGNFRNVKLNDEGLRILDLFKCTI